MAIVPPAKPAILTTPSPISTAFFARPTSLVEVKISPANRERIAITPRTVLKKNRLSANSAGTAIAPMEFFMPLSTMVNTGQENQMILHGGNYVRNFFGIFVLIALFYAIFKDRNWRDLSLIGAFAVGYLGVISVSGYGNAERFLLPALPCLLIMTAYGISKLNVRNYKYVKYWYIIVVVMEVAWAYFKIGSRGLL